MESFNDLVQTTVNKPKPNYTPSEAPLVDNLTNNFNKAVENGLEPRKIFKMVSIMTLVSERGITPIQLHNNIQLFTKLCIESDFSITDSNINDIFNQLANNS